MNMDNNQHKLSLFVFRRDLRLADNTSLLSALKNSDRVIPAFIFDPRQYKNNTYQGMPSLQFLVESLQDLQTQLQEKTGRLFLFDGIAEKVIEKIILDHKIDAVYFNRDYTPFSQRRDHAIADVCKKHGVSLHTMDDALLNPPQSLLKPDGTPYQIFSRYYALAKEIPVATPQKNNHTHYFVGKINNSASNEIFRRVLPTRLASLAEKGGRSECIRHIQHLKNIGRYDAEHDYPYKNTTSGLSPYLKFTTCSVREIYYAAKKYMPEPEGLLREIYWRDFFTMIAFHFPHVFGHAFIKKYNHLSWQNNPRLFDAWCQGKTGFPIVDAGMRQLNQTGLMHNRVRLITASFLIKDLHINWQWGEKYFAERLIDYDPAVNNGNWQWVAGTGTDAQPYFRIFNPWLQQKKFDADCDYIKQWVPELKNIDKKIIHQWEKLSQHSTIPNYPAPIVNHANEARIAKKNYSVLTSK